MSGHTTDQKFYVIKWWWITAHLKDNFILVMFHIETICQKQMVLPENQFDCTQIQGIKYSIKYIKPIYLKEINNKKICSQNFIKTSFYKRVLGKNLRGLTPKSK